MKLINLNTNAVLALVTAVVIAVSVPAKAEETGFTLEDSIRNQIFMELKANVQNLYQSGGLIVPSVDTSVAARIASTNASGEFALPININGITPDKERAVKNIN